MYREVSLNSSLKNDGKEQILSWTGWLQRPWLKALVRWPTGLWQLWQSFRVHGWDGRQVYTQQFPWCFTSFMIVGKRKTLLEGKKKKSSHDSLASICQKACGIHKTKWKSFLWDDETKNKRSGFNFQCFRFGVFICWWRRDVDMALCCRRCSLQEELPVHVGSQVWKTAVPKCAKLMRIDPHRLKMLTSLNIDLKGFEYLQKWLFCNLWNLPPN